MEARNATLDGAPAQEAEDYWRAQGRRAFEGSASEQMKQQLDAREQQREAEPATTR